MDFKATNLFDDDFKIYSQCNNEIISKINSICASVPYLNGWMVIDANINSIAFEIRVSNEGVIPETSTRNELSSKLLSEFTETYTTQIKSEYRKLIVTIFYKE